MKQKKPMNIMVFVLLLVGVFVAYVSATTLIRGCQSGKPELPAMNDEQLEPYLRDLSENGKDPAEYVSGLFAAHDVVFLGNMMFLEALQVKQQVDLVVKLVPVLYKQGVTAVGVLNVMAREQEQIDRVVTARDFDEKAVQKLLFDRAVMGGFEEYVDLFRAVWSLNKERPAHAQPMRILGLSPEVHFEYLRETKEKKDTEDTEDPVIYKKIFGNLIVDNFILEVIDKQVVQTQKKALIFLPQENCIIHDISQAMVKRYQKLGFEYTGSAAYQLNRKIGDRCVSVFLHSPWWLFKGENIFPDYPAEGVFDVLLTKVPSGDKYRGLTLTAGPLGEIPLKKPYWLSLNFYLDPGDTLRLKDLCDGYILLGPLALYQDVTPIKDFINESNFQEALNKAPWPNPETAENGVKLTPEKMNQVFNEVYPNFFKNMMSMFSK